MKEQVLLYVVCSAISFGAVVVTSLVKLIISSIAKKCGRDLSGNVKEYIFAPMAILIAASGLYVWLDKFCRLLFDEKFILILVCFSVGTMLLYLMLFQPTRKFAMKIIQIIAKTFKVPEIVNKVKDALTETEILLNLSEEELQSTAEQNDVLATVEEKPPGKELTADAEADKLRAMVEVIKNNK